MITKQTIISRNEDIQFKVIDSKVIILDAENELLRELNDTASFIWLEIEKPTSLQKLSEKIIKEFDASEEDILTDLVNFVNLYEDAGLINIGE